MKRAATALLLLLALSLAAPAAAGKVGFIDIQRILEESDLGKSARKDLDRFIREKETALTSLGREVEAMSAKAETLAGGDRRDMEVRLQEKVQTYRRMEAESREAIDREQTELVGYVLRRTEPLLRRIGHDEGYDLIIKDRMAVGFVAGSADITDRVIQLLNAEKDAKK